MTSEVPFRPKPRSNDRKSAPVSPTVVPMILMIQNNSVTSGTLFRRGSASVAARALMTRSLPGLADARLDQTMAEPLQQVLDEGKRVAGKTWKQPPQLTWRIAPCSL